jgi:hypothetical protein
MRTDPPFDVHTAGHSIDNLVKLFTYEPGSALNLTVANKVHQRRCGC